MEVSLPEKRYQLEQLRDVLSRLISIVNKDSNCKWRQVFESALQECEQLLTHGFTQDDLTNLSISITHIYGGSGSFSDYSPSIYDKANGRYTPIVGTENFNQISNSVAEAAQTLRVVGSY
jgi:uncharacterized protein DUF6966